MTDLLTTAIIELLLFGALPPDGGGHHLTYQQTKGHFRVPKTLTLETRLSAKPFFSLFRRNNPLHIPWFRTQPRFETDGWRTSEMAYSINHQRKQKKFEQFIS